MTWDALDSMPDKGKGGTVYWGHTNATLYHMILLSGALGRKHLNVPDTS